MLYINDSFQQALQTFKEKLFQNFKLVFKILAENQKFWQKTFDSCIICTVCVFKLFINLPSKHFTDDILASIRLCYNKYLRALVFSS